MKPGPNRLLIGSLAAGLCMTLAACGSSKSNDSATQNPAPTPLAADTPPPCSTAAPAGANSFPTPSPVPQGAGAVKGVPAITANATDFDKEPTVAKGTGTAPTKLLIRDQIIGSCRTAGPNDTVNVRYVGTLFSDGTVFDSSWKDNGGPAPTGFPLSGVVPGFAGGIVGMQVGGRREIVIPGFEAYGNTPPPGSNIPAGAALVFVVDLVSIA